MTALAVETPRLGHLHDLLHAAREVNEDPVLAPYWTGFIVGFTATFCSDDVFTDALTDARRVMFAGAYDLDGVCARIGLLGGNIPADRRAAILKASGTLFGWKQGTAERDDAEECVTCEARVLTRSDDDAARCSVGWFCSDDCHQAFDAYRCCKDEPEDRR